MKEIKNMGFSVKERLKSYSAKNKRTFNDLLKFYVMERILYRLSKSEFSNKFILKGALMFRVWNYDKFRPTQDIDLLGKTDNSEQNIREVFERILSVKVENDGLEFYPGTIKTTIIKEEADYQGIRLTFNGKLDTAKIDTQIDIGFDDVIYPEPQKIEYPVILNFSKPEILCYSKETVIAEKFEAMAERGNFNSRMKDFYDIWILSHNFSFDLTILSGAVKRTFEHRRIKLDDSIDAFKKEFLTLKQIQWKAYRNKINQQETPETFKEIMSDIIKFLRPVINPTNANLKWDPEKFEWIK